jgi:hypothetical protein
MEREEEMKIFTLLDKGLCSTRVRKCRSIKNRSECNNHYTINKITGVREPCRKGVMYGCRENNEPKKQNNMLNTICRHNVNIEEAKKMRKRSFKSIHDVHDPLEIFAREFKSMNDRNISNKNSSIKSSLESQSSKGSVVQLCGITDHIKPSGRGRGKKTMGKKRGGKKKQNVRKNRTCKKK